MAGQERGTNNDWDDKKQTFLQCSNSLDREGHRSGTNSGDSYISFISLGDDITGAQNKTHFVELVEHRTKVKVGFDEKNLLYFPKYLFFSYLATMSFVKS